MDQQPQIGNLYGNREKEVSLAEKQRLFALASDVLWFGDTESRQVKGGGIEGIFVDNQGELSVSEHLAIHWSNEKWAELPQIDVTHVYIDHWSERTSKIMTYPDQINIGIFDRNNGLEFFTIQTGLGDNLDQLQIGNRVEMQAKKRDWLELSASDAARVEQVLSKIMDILINGVATP